MSHSMLLAFLAVSTTPPAAMEEVPYFMSRRIATIADPRSDPDVLVVRTRPFLEVGRWSPRTGERLWAWSAGPGNEECSCAAVASIGDQDGDGHEDWALAHGVPAANGIRSAVVVTIGSGRTGSTIRVGRVPDVGRHFTLARVRTPLDGCDLVLGCPFDRSEYESDTGWVTWLRSADLAVAARTLAPPGEGSFGAFVDNPIEGDPTVWIGATTSGDGWRVWSATSSSPSKLSILVEGARPDPAVWGLSLEYGSWVSVSPTPSALSERTLVVGAPGYPADGRVVHGKIGAWADARTLVGRHGVFGTHFGEIVLVLDDLDGDGAHEWLVTDPAYHGEDQKRAFTGGLYVVCSDESAPRLLGDGEKEMQFLGVAMLPVGDVDGGGRADVVVLATPRARDPWFEVWSIERLARIRTIRATTAP